jgi:hypothetical protein
MAEWLGKGSAIAGLLAGSLAWGASTEVNMALATRFCTQSLWVTWLIALVCIALSLAGGLLSWRAFRLTPQLEGIDDSRSGQPRRAMSGISIALAVLFGLVILLQAVGSLFISGCIR